MDDVRLGRGEGGTGQNWAQTVRHRFESAGLPSVGLPDVVTEEQARELISGLVARLRQPSPVHDDR